MNKNSILCPLCQASKIEDHSSQTYLCRNCYLIFKKQMLEPLEERQRYTQHNNDLNDPRYLNYLNELWELRPVGSYKKVLDFGCGPTKGLEALVRGDFVESYDVYFYPKELGTYDLVFCCEVVEHFNQPHFSWELLAKISKNILLVRTQIYDSVDFESWYYKDDPTHVCFYSYKTFGFISEEFGFSIEGFKDNNKFVLKKG